jgi:hypothetical protein
LLDLLDAIKNPYSDYEIEAEYIQRVLKSKAKTNKPMFLRFDEDNDGSEYLKREQSSLSR